MALINQPAYVGSSIHANSHCQRHSVFWFSDGFTIIELLMTVAIMSISLSIAVPNFNDLVKKTEQKTTALSLHSTLKNARSYALSNQVMVIVCQANINHPEQCHPKRIRYSNWQNGWITYADLNRNNELDEKDNIIAISRPSSDTAVVFNQTGRLRFFPRGSARSAGFYFCNPDTKHTHYIRLLHTGRSRLSTKLNKSQQTKCQNQIKK